jgi:hypothetical protein
MELAGDPQCAKILWRKIRIFEAFPQSYAEITKTVAGNGIYGNSADRRPWVPNRKYMTSYARKLAILDQASHQPVTESSACLLLALTKKAKSATLDEAGMKQFIADTDGDGAMELIDSWGNVLQFRRWLTKHLNLDLVSLNPQRGSAKEKFGDPLDPEGVLQQGVRYDPRSPPWSIPESGPILAALFYMEPEQLFPTYQISATLQTTQPYYVPYVFSAGRDGISSTADDIYSYRRRAGSQ